MFQQKLAAARASQSKKQKRIAGYGGLAIFIALLVGAFAYLTVQLERARSELQAQQAPQSNVPQIENVEVTPPAIKPPTPPANNAAAQIEPPLLRETPSASADARARFMQQLAQYESETEPKIEALNLPNWNQQRHAELKHAELMRLKARAITDFSKGEYLSARQGLQQADALVAMLSAEYDNRLAALKRAAKQAFENQRAPEAEQAIQQALRLKPDDAEMLALQPRGAVLPQVLALLRQAEIAKTENRPEKEIAALRKVLTLDPSRQLEARVKTLQAQLAQQRFSDAVRHAQRALDAGKLSDAEQQIARAKKILPANKLLAPLQQQLQQAQTDAEFNNQTARGEQARQRDDWQAAARHFQRARTLKPNHKTALENHDLATRMVNVMQKIQRALAQVHRLGDLKIVNSMAEYLRQVEPLVGMSPGLQKIHAELAGTVKLYQTEVDVVVVSDNKTNIIVRGIGQVGKTLRRTIRLRPGERVFEGSRAGYKSKLVTLDIAPAASVQVTIVCDEKI